MDCLLDTCVLLWAIERKADGKLTSKARNIISDPQNTMCVSIASLWEIAIKSSKGKLNVDLRELLNEMKLAGFEILAIEEEYLLALKGLRAEGLHSDPFDQLIIATAQVEGMVLITPDKAFQNYNKIQFGKKTIILGGNP